MPKSSIRCHPLTPDRWDDFERLFGPRGACGGCWCMWYRLTYSAYERAKGAANKRAMKRLVAKGERPGIIAYARGEPVGWCAVAPRQDYRRLAGSRVLAPPDDEKVWSVVCLFVRKDRRRSGLSATLLHEAAGFAARRGAKVVEGYPIDPTKSDVPPAFAATGIASAYRAAGFKEVLRRSRTRPIMRKRVAAEARRQVARST